MTIYEMVFGCFLYLATIRFYKAVAIMAVKGSTVQLECPFKDTGAGTLDWSFKSTLSSKFVLYTINAEINPGIPSGVNQRLTVTGNYDIGEYHLHISDIRESDQGTYQCIDGFTGNKNSEALTVIVGPTAVSLEKVTPDNKIPGIEGQTMTIICTAVGGQPAPDVKLVILGSNYTAKQSTQYTFKPISSSDGANVTCLAGYEAIKSYPLITSANIHLKLKPVITPFSLDTLSTEETKSFYVSCRSTGSRPVASMYWFLGQQNITSNSTYQSNQESSTDKYTVTSNLRYSVDRRYNGQKLLCRAFNIAGYMEGSLTLNVKYAPGVAVENETFLQTQALRQIPSTLDSNPPVNTCTWRHRSKFGENIREFSNNNQILTLPAIPADERYQDTGEYICTAVNGIIGLNGQLKQTGSGFVISNAPSVITADNKDNSTQYGKFGKSTKVYVNVYSIPKYSSIRWYIGNIQLVSNKYVTSEEPAIVKDVFHGVDVQLDGYRITLTISDLQVDDFTNYTLRLYYSSQYVQHEVTIESASAPQTPLNFTIISSGETSVTFQWISGYDGGQKQTFNIEYHISGTDTWMSQEIEIRRNIDLHNIYTLSGLRDKTTYELRMYAKNKFDQSQHTDIETITTISKEAITSSNAIIGTVAGVLVVLLIVCAVIISFLIFRKRKGKKKTTKNTGFYENSGFQNVQLGDEYEEVVSKSDTQEKQTSKTYEALRTKENVDVYVDLENSKGLPSSKSSSKTYESLGTKDAAEMYDDLNNHKGLPSSKPSVDHYEALGTQDKPSVYEELENQKGQEEKVYVNAAF